MTTARGIADALAFAASNARESIVVLVSGARIFSATAPRLGDAVALDDCAFRVVAHAQSAVFAHGLRLDEPGDETLAAVAATFPTLQRLSIVSVAGVDAPLVAMLSQLRGHCIRHLDLSYSFALTDVALRLLRPIAPSIQVLILGDSVRDSNFKCLVGFARLREFAARSVARVTDEGLACCLGESPCLEVINLFGFSKVTGSFIGHLLEDCCVTLHSLTLRSCRQVADAPLERLQHFVCLRNVDVGRCELLTVRFIEYLACGSALTLTSVKAAPGCRPATGGFASFRLLGTLAIWFDRDTDFAALGRLAHLQSLTLDSISPSPKLAAAQIAQLAPLHPVLTSLVVQSAVMLDDDTGAALEQIGRLTSLTELSISMLTVPHERFTRLASLTRLRRLSLWLPRCVSSDVTVGDVRFLARLGPLERIALPVEGSAVLLGVLAGTASLRKIGFNMSVWYYFFSHGDVWECRDHSPRYSADGVAPQGRGALIELAHSVDDSDNVAVDSGFSC